MAGDKSLKESAKDNPSALGDPVSLKAESSDRSPTEKERPNQSSHNTSLQGSQSNPTQGVKQLAPTEQDIDQGTQNPSLRPDQKHQDNKSLKEVAQQDLEGAKKGNRSMLGDPTSLKAENSERDPVEGEQEDGTGRGGGAPMKGRDSKL